MLGEPRDLETDLLGQLQVVTEQNTQAVRETNQKTDVFVERVRRLNTPVVAG